MRRPAQDKPATVAARPGGTEVAVQPPPTARGRARARRGGDIVGGFTGAVTAGLVVLTLVLVGVQVYGSGHGEPGPGALSIGSHVTAAVLCLCLQRVVDRRHGVLRGAGMAGVLGVTGAVLWLLWWR